MAEKIETINEYLKVTFGIDTDDGQPIFRVVWSEDQYEKRETKYTDSGVELLYPEVRLLPKYKQFIKDSYILERRVLVPDISKQELAGAHKSYEPLWVFRGTDGNPIPPAIIACKFVIDAVYAALGKKSLSKYKDPMEGLTQEEAYELNKQRIDKIQEELFGDESGLLGDTIDASGSTIIMPKNYDKDVH